MYVKRETNILIGRKLNTGRHIWTQRRLLRVLNYCGNIHTIYKLQTLYYKSNRCWKLWLKSSQQWHDSILVLRGERKPSKKSLYTPFSDVTLTRESAENHLLLFFFFLFSNLHRKLGSFIFICNWLYTFVLWHKIPCCWYETSHHQLLIEYSTVIMHKRVQMNERWIQYYS